MAAIQRITIQKVCAVVQFSFRVMSGVIVVDSSGFHNRLRSSSGGSSGGGSSSGSSSGGGSGRSSSGGSSGSGSGDISSDRK
jgi:hypothetical protein